MDAISKKRTTVIERTPWRARFIVWPGCPFRTLPFPYLFHRYDVHDSETGWCGSFFLRRHAKDRLAFTQTLIELVELEERVSALEDGRTP